MRCVYVEFIGSSCSAGLGSEKVIYIVVAGVLGTIVLHLV